MLGLGGSSNQTVGIPPSKVHSRSFGSLQKPVFSAHFPSKQCTFLCLANGEMLRDIMQEIKDDPFMGNSVDSHHRRYTNKDSKAMEKVSAPAGCWWHPSRAVQLVHPAHIKRYDLTFYAFSEPAYIRAAVERLWGWCGTLQKSCCHKTWCGGG